MRFGKFGKSVVLGTALVLAAGCGGGGATVDDTAYVEATPDLSGTAMEINGEAAAEEGAALIAEGFGVHQGELNGTGPEFLEGARVTIKTLNTTLKLAISPIAALTNSAPVEDAQVKEVLVYGPQDVGDANWRFKMKKVADNRFVWKLEARAKGSTDDAAFKLISAGGLTKGAKAHRGRGTIGVNLDNYKAVVPSATVQGKLMASFAHTAGDDKALSYRLKGFSPNPANFEPLTGVFVGHRLMPSKATRIRIFTKHNLAQSETAQKETLFSTIRFVPGKGGRADVLAVGGDIPADRVYHGAACWDPQEQETFRILRVCAKGTLNCVKLSESGTRTACPSDWQNDVEAPSENPENTTQEPGAPADAQPEPAPADVTADF